jgi:hypothetical protein
MDDIDKLIKAITSKGLGEGEGWPLLAPQITSYFDVDQALDLYYMITDLTTKHPPEEIGKLFITPTNLRYLLSQNAIIGLKIARALKIKEISLKDMTSYVSSLIEIMKTMVTSDPFVFDKQNIVLSDEQVTKLLDNIHLIQIDNDNRRKVLEVGVDLFTYAWALNYSAFLARGYEIHGPYSVELNGKSYKLVIRENIRMDAKEIWGIETQPNNVKLLMFYESDATFELNYYNQPVSTDHNESLAKVCVIADGKNLKDLDSITTLLNNVNTVGQAITNHVNKLSKMEQVYKGAEISFSMFEDIYEKSGFRADSKTKVDTVFKLVGEKFLNSGNAGFVETEISEWAKIYDPRTDYLGYIADALNE